MNSFYEADDYKSICIVLLLCLSFSASSISFFHSYHRWGGTCLSTPFACSFSSSWSHLLSSFFSFLNLLFMLQFGYRHHYLLLHYQRENHYYYHDHNVCFLPTSSTKCTNNLVFTWIWIIITALILNNRPTKIQWNKINFSIFCGQYDVKYKGKRR